MLYGMAVNELLFLCVCRSHCHVDAYIDDAAVHGHATWYRYCCEVVCSLMPQAEQRRGPLLRLLVILIVTIGAIWHGSECVTVSVCAALTVMWMPTLMLLLCTVMLHGTFTVAG